MNNNSNCETVLNISKENFKFSSAHFLIFDAHRAEMLHGHNYQVRVVIVPNDQSQTDEKGYFIDFSEIKKHVKDLCDQWDEHILLPQLNSEMKCVKNKNNDDITFRDRFYAFPSNEVIWLQTKNTSVEELSRLFAENLANKFKAGLLKSIEVTIEETRGQSATSFLQLG